MDIEKRRQYQRAYYRKHKDKLKDRYKSYREKHAEREKQLRHERWLIARYIPPEVQQEILYGEWLGSCQPLSDILALSSPAESVECIDI
ncbi:hypothetical protein I8H89_04025 [Candidatus Saccharibacteria bacterium]|nr:hypothetical protein [Candidatus Saccharibacteria bacterium]